MAEAPVNKPVDAISRLIHELVMEVAYNVAIEAAMANSPWLRMPIISTVFRGVARLVFARIETYIEQAAVFATIDAQVNAQAKAYQDAVKKLRDAANAEEEARAIQNFKDTFGRLIRTRYE